MGAEIEWLTGVMRAGKNFKKYGDVAHLSFTVQKIGHTAKALGAMSDEKAIVSNRIAIIEECRKYGIAVLEFDILMPDGTFSRKTIRDLKAECFLR